MGFKLLAQNKQMPTLEFWESCHVYVIPSAYLHSPWLWLFCCTMANQSGIGLSLLCDSFGTRGHSCLSKKCIKIQEAYLAMPYAERMTYNSCAKRQPSLSLLV